MGAWSHAPSWRYAMVDWTVEDEHSTAAVNGHRLQVRPDETGTGYEALLEREPGCPFVFIIRHGGRGGQVFDSATEARAALESEVAKLL